MEKDHMNYTELRDLFVALLAAGYRIHATDAWDEEEEMNADHNSDKHSVDDFMKNIDVDDFTICVSAAARPTIGRKWIYIVLGNEPGVVVCDYTGGDEHLDRLLLDQSNKHSEDESEAS